MQVLITHLVQIRDLLNHHPLFATGILLIAGYTLGKVAALVRLPEITGFIVAGIVLGKAVSGIVPPHMSESFTIVTEVALGLIALTIGAEFSWAKLRRTGREAILITVIQIAATFALVTLALIVGGMSPPFALLLGVIASATAPAATVAIVQSLRARGLFVDYLYGVVALDDAGCVILFGAVFALVGGVLTHGGSGLALALPLFAACAEVLLSLAMGAAGGLCLHYAVRNRQNAGEIMIVALGVVFMTTAVAIVFHLSPLMTNMAAGTMLINLSARNHRIFRALEPLTPPLYALFFVIAGTELDPLIIAQGPLLVLGLLYIVARAAGKYGGVFCGALLSNTPLEARRYLGFCMLPQAGVAIGLVLHIEASPILAKLGPAYTSIVADMVNIVLLSVFVNELIGPPLSRYAIIKGTTMEA